MFTTPISAELLKLHEEGYGMYIDRDKMESDKVFGRQKCLSVFLKKEPEELHESFFTLAKDTECNEEMYESNYYKDVDETMKKVATHYSEDLTKLVFSLPSDITNSMYNYIKIEKPAHCPQY